MSGLVKRSFTLARHRTSIALEGPFWTALEQIAAARGQTLLALVTAADVARDPAVGLASALRLLVLDAAQKAGAEPPRR
jgi:predicted DNA-binding ribbon-helix-helix protein